MPATRKHAAPLLAFLVLLLALFTVLGAGTPASATPHSSTTVDTEIHMIVTAKSGDTPTPPDINYLPVNRWKDTTTGFHYRLDADMWSNIAEKINRNMTSSAMMSAGNALWSLTTNMTDYAARFNVLDSAGHTIDGAAADLGEAVIKSPILAILAVATLLTALWRTYTGRGGGMQGLKMVARNAAIVGLLVVMVNGAGQSQEGKPGMWSPVWMATQINGAVQAAAGTVANSIATQATISGFEEGRTDAYSCTAYVNAMKTTYQESAGKGFNQASLATPIVLSNLWEATGLRTWAVAQFGDNPDGQSVYCRLLEQMRATPAAEQITIQKKACAINDVSPCLANENEDALAWGASAAFDGTDYNNARDRGMIAWAACAPSKGAVFGTDWTRQKGWSGFKPDKNASDVQKECDQWWTASNFDGGQDGGFLSEESFLNVREWDSSVVEALPGKNNTDQREFIFSLHGNASAGNTGTISTILFLLSALINAAIFGVLSLIIIMSKAAIIVFVYCIIVALVVSLWPGKADDHVLGQFAKTYTGTAFISFGYSLIMTMLVSVSGMVVSSFQSLAGVDKTVLNILATALSPLVALMLMSFAFKNIFKVPNPMSLKGAMAWSGMAGGIGGAVGGYLGSRGSRLADKAKGAVSDKVRGATGMSSNDGGRTTFGRGASRGPAPVNTNSMSYVGAPQNGQPVKGKKAAVAGKEQQLLAESGLSVGEQKKFLAEQAEARDAEKVRVMEEAEAARLGRRMDARQAGQARRDELAGSGAGFWKSHAAGVAASMGVRAAHKKAGAVALMGSLGAPAKRLGARLSPDMPLKDRARLVGANVRTMMNGPSPEREALWAAARERAHKSLETGSNKVLGVSDKLVDKAHAVGQQWKANPVQMARKTATLGAKTVTGVAAGALAVTGVGALPVAAVAGAGVLAARARNQWVNDPKHTEQFSADLAGFVERKQQAEQEAKKNGGGAPAPEVESPASVLPGSQPLPAGLNLPPVPQPPTAEGKGKA